MTSGPAGRILKRSNEMVRIYVKTGRLPAVRSANGTLVFRRADVLRLAAELAEQAEQRVS